MVQLAECATGLDRWVPKATAQEVQQGSSGRGEAEHPAAVLGPSQDEMTAHRLLIHRIAPIDSGFTSRKRLSTSYGRGAAFGVGLRQPGLREREPRLWRRGAAMLGDVMLRPPQLWLASSGFRVASGTGPEAQSPTQSSGLRIAAEAMVSQHQCQALP